MNSENDYSVIDDAPVEAALADYFNRVDRGENIELTEIIAAHPGCEIGLRQFLNQERKLHEVVAVVSLPSAAVENLTGRTLGDFRLERVVGRGGMGVVWQAKQLSLGRTAAVKLLPAALCSDSRHRARFQNEARILAQLEHANIVNVLAVGEDADTYYFAMQYVEGMTADELIRLWKEKPSLHDAETARGLNTGDTTVAEPGETADKRASGQLPLWVAHRGDRRERYRMCARIAAEVADGLAHAHACGVLHRDVKPSNILLDKTGTARLSDFGLARMYGDATLTATGAILGTLRYASPEQLGGTSAAVDERSDVYSLGVTLWELVTGERLFMADNQNTVISQVLNVDAPRPSSFAARLPRDLETVIARAMAKEPRDRYVSAQAFGDDLRRFLDGRPIQAKPITLGERAFRWANRNRMLATTAVGALVILAAVAMLASGLILSANSRTAAALATSRDNEAKAQQNAVSAEVSERRTRELLYADVMARAGDKWHKNEPAQVRLLLDRYAKPKTRDDGSSEEDPRGFEWYFLDRQIRPQSELLFQNDKALYLVEFMPGGKEFFTAGMDSIVRWHDSKTGKVLRSLDTRQLEVNGVSYNPAATLLSTAGDDGSVKIWNAAELSLLRSIKACDGRCYYAKFLSNELLFTGGAKTPHRLINVTSGKLVREYTPPTPKLPQGCFASSLDAYCSRSGERFWTTELWSDSYMYQGLYEWNIESGESRRLSEDVNIRTVFADKTEKYLFVDTVDGQIRILDAKSGHEFRSIRLGNGIGALTVSPDERQLLAGDRDGQIYVWTLDLSKPGDMITSKPDRFLAHEGVLDAIAFAPGGESLVTAGRDGSVRRTRLQPTAVGVREHQWLRDRLCIPIAGTDHVVATKPLAVRERATGKLIKTLSTEHYSGLGINSDGTLIAAGSATHVGVWNAITGERLLRLNQERKWSAEMDFSPDNALLSIYSYDYVNSRVDIADLATGKINPYPVDGTPRRPNFFCIGGGLIAWLSDPAQLVCWNLRGKTVRWETKPHEFGMSGHAISPDRKTLLTADRRILRLFDCANGKVLYKLTCEYPVTSLAFFGDGRTFVVGGDQGQLSLWHAGLGQRLVDVADLGTQIHSIHSLGNGFLACTRRVINGSEDLRRWYEF